MPTFEHFPKRNLDRQGAAATGSAGQAEAAAAGETTRRRRNRDALIADNLMSTESGRAAIERMRRECQQVGVNSGLLYCITTYSKRMPSFEQEVQSQMEKMELESSQGIQRVDSKREKAVYTAFTPTTAKASITNINTAGTFKPHYFVPSIQSGQIPKMPPAKIQGNSDRQFYNMEPFEDVAGNVEDPPQWQRFWTRHQPTGTTAKTKILSTVKKQPPLNQVIDVPTFSSDIAKLQSGGDPGQSKEDTETIIPTTAAPEVTVTIFAPSR